MIELILVHADSPDAFLFSVSEQEELSLGAQVQSGGSALPNRQNAANLAGMKINGLRMRAPYSSG